MYSSIQTQVWHKLTHLWFINAPVNVMHATGFWQGLMALRGFCQVLSWDSNRVWCIIQGVLPGSDGTYRFYQGILTGSNGTYRELCQCFWQGLMSHVGDSDMVWWHMQGFYWDSDRVWCTIQGILPQSDGTYRGFYQGILTGFDIL